MFLKIENKIREMPSVELMRMLGASASRGVDSKIGCFGSGFPNAIALLARKGLLEGTKICLGRDVYLFDTELHTVKDSSGYEHDQWEIRMRKQNGASWNLNISTKFGELDWTDIGMALREMISNACDGAESYDGTYKSVVVELVEDNQARAKDGYIRVYIPVNEEVSAYIDNLHHYFRCLKPGYNPAHSVTLNLTGGPAKVYRKGVLVGEFGTKSLFNYDIKDIKINESRLVDSWTAKAAAATVISLSKNEEILSRFIAARIAGDKSLWENQFDDSYFNLDNMYYLKEKQKEEASPAWASAVKRVVAHKVVCDSAIAQKMVESKGLEVLRTDDSIIRILLAHAEKTADKVLNQNEIQGKIIIPATDIVQSMLDRVWVVLVEHDQTMGKDKPSIACYVQHTTEGAFSGYYRPGGNTIYVEKKHADSYGAYTLQVVIEEISHYVTGAHDFTREFQSYAFNLAALLMLKNETYIRGEPA